MKLVLTFLLTLFSASLLAEKPMYTFNNPAQEAQFKHLLPELRCLVCQNQDLADSNAELAKDLRNEVYQQVISGRSDQEIIQYLQSRYGDFILFRPPLKALTWILWFGPLLFMLSGLVFFWRWIKKSRIEE